MAVAAPGSKVLLSLRAGSPLDSLPAVSQNLFLRIARENPSDSGEVPANTAVRVGRLRRIAAAKLALWGISAHSDDVLLLISELLTNGLRYGAGHQIEFRLALAEGVLVVEVDDHSPGRPVVRNTRPAAESGRGMLLIDALADAWGVSRDGTRTWCTLEVPGAEGRRP